MHPVLQQLEQRFQPSIMTPIHDPLLIRNRIELWLKRDDLIHPILSGNKWRKLKYILDHALTVNANTLISMGGRYSNHLHALAFIGHVLNIPTIGYVRGEPPTTLTPTLQDAQNWGMSLHFISRSDYRQLRHYQDWDSLPNLPIGGYWVPEGGAQVLALQGVAEIVSEIQQPFDWLCVPCGTGATLAGLIKNTSEPARVLGFAALKNGGFLYNDVTGYLPTPHTHWQINLDYHFGGFAQTTPELMVFCTNFLHQTGITLEPIYTGKMLFGLYDLIQNGFFSPGSRLIAIHTGGLQGNRGFAI